MSTKSKALVLTMIAAAALAAGCATPEPTGTPVDPNADVRAKIAASADRVSLSMQRLAAMRSATYGVKVVDFKTPVGLETEISINWAGPIDGLARKISELTGYTFDGTLGPVPTTPVIVSVSATDTSAFSILADAGAQAGTAADIIVQPETKRIIVKYPPVTRTGGYANVSR